MLVAAALVPDTALLVPGAGGRADPGASLREAALAAVTEVVHAVDEANGALGAALDSERPGLRGGVYVVAPGWRDHQVIGAVRASLGAAGVPDEVLGWPPIGPAGAPMVGVSAAVGLLLARQCGVRASGVVEIAAPTAYAGRATQAHAVGIDLADRDASALVVVGSLSARHGPDAPLADDPRAPGYDEAVLADLADAGEAARLRLWQLDPVLADELAVTGWGPWLALTAAVGDAGVDARLLHSEVLTGAAHAVLTWHVTG